MGSQAARADGRDRGAGGGEGAPMMIRELAARHRFAPSKERDMEYEIGDDPQGLLDCPEGDRDGGLSEGGIMFRHETPAKIADRYDDASDEDTALGQFGEAT